MIWPPVFHFTATESPRSCIFNGVLTDGLHLETKEGSVMAAISCIIGSVLGWIAAATALFLGALASTAFLVFMFTSVGFVAMMVCVASMRATEQ